jgi:hypothetical protein
VVGFVIVWHGRNVGGLMGTKQELESTLASPAILASGSKTVLHISNDIQPESLS